MSLNQHDKSVLMLASRTQADKNGWRKVSAFCWPAVLKFATPELLEIDRDNFRIRLTPEAEAVVKYALT